MSNRLNIETLIGDSGMTLVLTGDFVLKTAHVFQYVTSSLILTGTPKLQIDLRGVEGLDCIGMARLAEYVKKARAAGREVEALVRYNRLLWDPGMRLLSDYFTIHEEAL